jgi:hypothetical protein
MNDMKLPPPPASKAKPAPPSFDITKRHEVIESKSFGKVTINDIGADGFERLAIEAKGDSDLLMRTLLCAAATGPHGERFTVDMLAAMPARCFADRLTLMRAAANVNGLSGEEVEKP